MRKTAFVVSPKSRISIELSAERYLELLYPENLRTPTQLDVRRMMDRLEDEFEVGFGVADLPEGEEGYTDPATREIIIDTKVYRAMLAGDGRSRLTCAHEVGHIPHISQVNSVIRDGGPRLARHQNISAPVYCDAEWQANCFASSLLMPRATTPQVYRRGGEAAVMESFGVSFSAASVRITTLRKQGLIR